MIEITLKLFGAAAESTGVQEANLSLPEGITAEGLRARLVEIYPSLDKLSGSLAIAMDLKYCKPDDNIRDGSEIAVIPPVGGG